MRVLVAYEDSHHIYSEVIAKVIRDCRPHLQIKNVWMSALEAEIERLDPHLVLSERSNPALPGGRGAWVKHSYEPSQPSEVCLDGRRWEIENPSLEDLLEIIDQAEGLVRKGRFLEGC